MGKRWNRKRKVEERRIRSIERKKLIPEELRNRGYVFNVQHSALMEGYYAYQGLFNLRREGSSFVPCLNSEEKEEERVRYNNSSQSILSASFRLGSDCHPLFRDKFIKELDEHAGRPIEIVLENNSSGPKSIKVETNNEQNGAHDEETEKNKAIPNKQTPTSNPASTTTRILPPVRSIPFIPHGYQLSVDRRTIRRNPSLSSFHEWLKVQTSSGFITRQETVSMIPPIVLSIEPHHAVLDMCAAPGSKTSQMLEVVSQIAPNQLEPEGFVVANDSDPKRAYMLINNLRRINSPAAFTASVDAQFFPQLKGFNNVDGINEGLFDRVLCDVPCSGDGTMRKNPCVWKAWSPLGSLALHPLQLNIAMKGATLTQVGGYMCYSTCSMNPVENEAVVAEILRLSKGSLELVDKRPNMPGLVARPGWSSWKVMASLKKDKNKMKKNKPKMNRQKEWEEKMKAATILESTPTNNTQNNNEDNKNSNVEMNMDEGEEINDVSDVSKIACKADSSANQNDENEKKEESKPDPGSQPLDWNEESLRKNAISLGLLIYDKFEDVPEHMSKRVRSSCFPPTKEELQKFHLERCMRCLPHDMDTGGFFIALFHKVAPVGVKARNKNQNTSTKENTDDVEEQIKTCETKEDVSGKDDDDLTKVDLKKKGSGTCLHRRSKTRGDVGNSNFVPVSSEVFPELIKFYGLNSNFPIEQIMCRFCGDAKILYFITRAIKERLIDRGIQRITVINSGLRVFERNSKHCEVRYRVNQEGIHMIAPYMTKRKVVVNFKDFVQCLSQGAICLSSFSEDLEKEIKKLSPGSFVVVLKGYEKALDKKMFIVMWRCRGDAVDCLVSQIEIEGMKCKLRAIAELHNFEYNPNEMNTSTKSQTKEGTEIKIEEKNDEINKLG